jgi:hypothetical protein
MTRGMANNTMTESVAPNAPAGPVAPVALVKKGKINMLDLGHALRGLQLCMLERDDVVYMKASWVIVFFYECHTDCVEHIMKDLRDTKELSQEIVTLKVGKYEGEWFTLAGAKMVLGMVPYQMTRKERAELAEEFKKFEKVKPAGEGKAGEARVAPEVVKLNDGQPLLHPFSPARDRPLAAVLVFPRASAIPAATRTSRRVTVTVFCRQQIMNRPLLRGCVSVWRLQVTVVQQQSRCTRPHSRSPSRLSLTRRSRRGQSRSLASHWATQTTP